MGKRGVGEKKQSTDFRETECCPSVIGQRAAQQKMVCMSGVPGVTGLSGRPTAFQPNSNGVGDCNTTLRQLLIGAVLSNYECKFMYI